MNKSFVSITIPCRNEELYIEKCINSILQSNYPAELITVFVCDGMSNDNTRGIVKKIVSLVQLNDNISIDKETIKIKLSETLPYYMIPSDIKFLASFPLNQNGKSDKKLLEKIYLQR